MITYRNMSTLRNPRLIRTLVFVGGHDRKVVSAMVEAAPDAICIDLEDSTPAAEKLRSRQQFHSVAAEIAESGIAVFARVNAPETGIYEDIDAVMCDELHCLSLPKVEQASQIHDFEALIATEEAAKGQEVGSVLIRPIIETPLGVINAYEIAASSPRVAYLGGVEGGIFGDLGGALGYVQTDDGTETTYLRSKVLIDARAAEVPFPIGGGMTARRDAEGARRFARENRILGYNGVHCAADADVIAAINDELVPAAADIASWLELMPALEEAERAGATVAHIDGRIYDLVGLLRVREQLDLAQRLGLVDDVARASQ
jgi:citrate lyase subunit beta/citryl-CoA lyase